MGFLGLTTPKWKHADPEVRLRAIADLPADKEALFADRARDDSDARVRATAASRVARADLLTGLLKSPDPAVVRIAGERLSGAAEILLKSKPWEEVKSLLDRIQDQKSLTDLTLAARDPQVRTAAFARLTALPEPSATLLATIAIQDAEGSFARQAVERISRRSDLKTVAAKAKVEAIRNLAKDRMATVVAEDRPSPEQVRAARRKAAEPLLAEGLRLAVGTDWSRRDAAWTDLRARLQALTAERPDVPTDAAFDEICERLQRAEADHRARADEAAARLDAAVAAREALLAELASAEAVDEAAWKARWHALAPESHDRIDALALRFREALAAHRPVVAAPVDPLSPADAEALAALSAEAEGLRQAGREARFRFQELHKGWTRLAADLPPQDPRRLRFIQAWQAWKDTRSQALTQRNEVRDARKEQLKGLVREAETLAAADAGTSPADHDRRAAQVQELQKRWRAVGSLPPSVVDPLKEAFRTACDAAWAPVAATREALAWERSAHLAHAEDLIARVNALASEEDLGAVAAAVKKAHQDWKNLGSLPREKGQEAWVRFKAACDTQFDRCAPWFAAQDAARAAHLAAKEALLAEVTALLDAPRIGLPGSPADTADQKTRAEAMTAAQERWKAIGPVPREADKALWTAWRNLLDRFYADRRATWDARHAEQVDTLNRKLGLIAEMVFLAEVAEKGQTEPGKKKPDAEIHAKLRELQATWKNLGHVPRDHVEKTWADWRAACDRVYATLKDHLAAQEAERQANLTAKLALITEVEELHALENPHWFKDDVREAQQKWRAIGHIPRERMDEVNERFRSACDRILRAEG